MCLPPLDSVTFHSNMILTQKERLIRCCWFGSTKSLADCNALDVNCLASVDCQRRIPMMMIRTGFMVSVGGNDTIVMGIAPD